VLTADDILEYYDDAVAFIDDLIICPGRQHIPDLAMTHDQKNLAHAISVDNRVSVESGHGTGKSTALAWIGIWFLITRHNTSGDLTKIPCIAPTFHQLYDIIWPEFLRWIPMSLVAHILEPKREEIFVRGHQSSSYIRARSPKTPNHVQGFHAAHLLWICDEAFGVTDDMVWETIEGSLTEDDNKIILAGQHTMITGYVHSTFSQDRDFWTNLRFDSEKSPVAKPEFAARIANKYGRESDIYRVRVKGMAPKGNPEAWIQLEQVEQAKVREVDEIGPLEMGVDCARFGDDATVVTLIRGNKVLPQVSQAKTDTDDIVNLALQTLRRYRSSKNAKNITCAIKVDISGGLGAGVVDMLRKNTTDNIRVIGVNFSAPGTDEYHDGVSVMWGELRDRIDYLQLPNNDSLTEELATRRFEYDEKNRVRIEPKKSFKKAYGGSPDHADSLVLAVTKAAAPKRVFAVYNPNNPDYCKRFEIDFKATSPNDAQIYGVLYLSRDLGLYGNWFFWGRKTRTLRVYDEIIRPNPVIKEVASAFSESACVPMKPISDYLCVTRVFANEEMIEGGYDTRKAFRGVGLRLHANPRFDEAGSIAIANYMFASHQIIVHYDSCPLTSEQYYEWRVENMKPVKGFPLCQNLLLVVNQLRESGELSEASEAKPYSSEKKLIRERLRSDGPVHVDRDKQYEYLVR
jgi:hypothetical protein